MSAVKIEMWVFNQYERMVIDQALSIIEAARAAQMETLKGNAPPGQREDPPVHPDEVPAQPEPQVVAVVEGGKVVGHIGAQPKAAPATEGPSETEMAAVVQKSLDKHGLALTREILAPLTGGKRWRESDPAVWPAIKEALEAAE